MRDDCIDKIDDIRDKVDKDTVNSELWIALITLLRDTCHSICRLEDAILGDGNGNKGIYDMMKEMSKNQSKRADDKFDFKTMMVKQVLPSVISALIIGLTGAAAGWWIAVNRLLEVAK